ncbi:hypothetical protein [Mycobacteroides franklinii]|uniref:GTPase n=1 Tax=Mycobacteroides franklinii TaxID=948102 RepID=A0A4R8R576_9MYCO|nr:hypothetical protein [Mycobacteroides franklinii]TDZ44172.1 hypothetical protein CCUG64054_04237 [Mycobacteroides franklinii]TDZ51305.1 hypothetical protein CCUG63697_02821 [Mycobacteroides franklinii]TDZ57726.1 hypothetical protein CCUG63696_04233 [Mycobacteroides franklinii]TDZ64667.1 hypothetical protein CCUG63695_04163 [Mycobacteroides franklinii]TDZ71065.1 hypothetical protein CCUG64056_04237 [Mycobacteroides franklinii]
MTRGFEVFRATLDRFATRPEIRQVHGGQRIHDVVVRSGDPLRVTVRGRAGVGVTSVIGALGRTLPAEDGPGHALMEVPIPEDDAADPLVADVDIVVFAEALKPEDRVVLEASTAPKVLILNKADLTDPGAARGPWSAAVSRCAQYRAETRVPTLPLSAHVPLVSLDDSMVEALKLMVENPADTSSVDAFVTCTHEVPVAMRRRILHELDLYPMGCAIGALRQVPTLAAPGLSSLLRDLSGIDAVVNAIRAAIAQGWYRRMRAVLSDLRKIGVTGVLPMQIDSFVNSDDVVVAAMQCAVDAVTAAGIAVELSDHPEDHRYRAERWQRFAAGPVNATYAAMGTDIARGSLRLWRRAGGRA